MPDSVPKAAIQDQGGDDGRWTVGAGTPLRECPECGEDGIYTSHYGPGQTHRRLKDYELHRHDGNAYYHPHPDT